MPFKKGQVANPKGRPVGALGKETLTKLERRAYFERRAQKKFDEWIDTVRPEYGLDQFLGKAEDKLDITTKGEGFTLTAEIVAEAKKKLKEKKTSE